VKRVTVVISTFNRNDPRTSWATRGGKQRAGSDGMRRLW
jgi:hypothetical protein